jgi:hypothetical protein
MALTTMDLKRSILARDAEISRLRRVLGNVEAKADLAASAMDEDERGQNIASALRSIAEYARSNAG